MLVTALPGCLSPKSDMNVETIFEQDRLKLYHTASERIERSLKRLLNDHDTVVFGVPGGRSAGGVFDALRDRDLPWRRIHIFMVDERVVPLESEESNFRILSEHLAGPLQKRGVLPPENVHPFTADPADVERSVSRYYDLLKHFCGRYHLLLLSMGEDAHIASLFPGTSVCDASAGHILVRHSPKPPAVRMSASKALLQRSLSAVLLCVGEAKTDAYRTLSDPDLPVDSAPVRLIYSLPEACILTDIS